MCVDCGTRTVSAALNEVEIAAHLGVDNPMPQRQKVGGDDTAPATRLAREIRLLWRPKSG